MKKSIITLLVFVLGLFAFTGFSFPKKDTTSIDVLPVFFSESKAENRVWVGTFQLAWNDFMDNIVKDHVKFVGTKSQMAYYLNQQSFDAGDVSDNSYYKNYGAISPKLKADIEKGIKDKFNETSDVLDSIDWTPGHNKYLVYAMLKKDFKFLNSFDELERGTFGKNKTEEVKYFGVNKESKPIVRESARVLFYNSPQDFALAIRTQGADEVYLYRTNANKPFSELYTDMWIKNGKYFDNKRLTDRDEIKIPDINLFQMKEFKELCNMPIEGTDGLVIGSAVETVDFKMNHEGVILKSEAAIISKMSMPIASSAKPRKFYFDDTFVLFMQEKTKGKPYFALRVYDVAAINKTGR